MSKLLEELRAGDILGPIKSLIDNHTLLLGNDGKIRPFLRARRTDTPWIIVRQPMDRLCAKWMQIYWNYYRFLPAGCFSCWKIVAKIDNLDELMRVHKLQVELDLPGKAGLDRRDYTPDNYGAFWYSPRKGGLKEARELHSLLVKKVHKICGSTIPVILKRGCTEMELMLGPSDKWQYTEQMQRFEQLLDTTFVDPSKQFPTPPVEKTKIMREWIEFAWEIYDPTFSLYSDLPPKRRLLNYVGTIHSEKDFPIPNYRMELLDDKANFGPTSWQEDDPDCVGGPARIDELEGNRGCEEENGRGEASGLTIV